MVATMKADWGWSNSGIAQETISGGQMVKAMSASSTDVNLLLVNAVGDGVLCVGIANNNATSGGRVGFATQGIYDMYAADTIVAGYAVIPADAVTTADAVLPFTGSVYSLVGSRVVGVAHTSAASGGAVRVLFNAHGATA